MQRAIDVTDLETGKVVFSGEVNKNMSVFGDGLVLLPAGDVWATGIMTTNVLGLSQHLVHILGRKEEVGDKFIKSASQVTADKPYEVFGAYLAPNGRDKPAMVKVRVGPAAKVDLT